jgi:hypothetical protein
MDDRSKARTQSPRTRTVSRRLVPHLETVEQRLLLSTFTVTNTGDSGDGSLRQAILDSNSSPGANTISFDIPGTGPKVIEPESPLPVITNSVVIDGYTQPGAAPNTATQGDNASIDIVIDGSNIPEWTKRTGLEIKADNSTIRGLAVDHFDAAGVLFVGSGDHLEGSFVGVDASGKLAEPNGLGVGVLGGSAVIGGTSPADRNVISGNLAGIAIASLSLGGSSFVTAQPGSVVQNNLIGTDATGTVDLGNGTVGLGVVGSGNVIGGTAPGAANTIAFNGKVGAVLNLGGGVLVAGLNSTGITPPALVSTDNLISANAIYSNHGPGIVQVTIPIDTLLPLLNPATASLPSLVTNVLTQVKIGSAGIIPNLTSAITSQGVTTVQGTIAGAASTTYQVQFFANAGQTFLGQTSVTTAASGAGTIAFVAPSSVTTGQVITATSIDPSNNTSSFSNSVTVSPPTAPSLAPTTVIPRPVQVTGPITLTTTRKATTGITVHFNGNVNGAENAGSYQLSFLSAKKTKYGRITTAEAVVVKSVTYDGGSQTATILPSTKLSPGKVYQLTILAPGIKDANGQALDGNRDGIAGGNLVATIAKGSVTTLGA